MTPQVPVLIGVRTPKGPFTAVQHKSATGASGTAPTLTLSAGPTQGDLLVATVHMAVSSVTLTMASSGWTALTPVATTSNRSSRMFYKIAGASESSTVTINQTVGGWSVAVIEYNPNGLTVNAPTENAQAVSSGLTFPTPIVTPTAGLQATVVCWVCVAANASSGWSNTQVNSSTSGVNTYETPHVGTSSGILFDQETTTSGTYVAQSTETSTGFGGGHIAVFTGS